MRSSSPDRKSDVRLAVVLGLAAIAPLVFYWRSFAAFFWFGDEYFLISQIDELGFWTWVWRPFSENYVPLFKLAWGGLIFAGGGSYALMVVAMWVTHGAIATCLALGMLRHGFDAWATALAVLVFAWSGTNIETLTWTVQWSAVLAMGFFVAALVCYPSPGQQTRTLTWKRAGVLILLATASAWSFSRGVCTGIVLALLLVLPWTAADAPLRRRLVVAIGCLVPPLVTALLIYSLSIGGHHGIFSDGKWKDALAFGTWYYALNPTAPLFGVEPPSWPLVALCGVVKVAVVTLALSGANRDQRILLTGLLLFDLAAGCC